MDRFSFDISIRAGGKALADIRGFSLARNRVTLLLGESGIGKTLISRCIYGLLDSNELDVRINGVTYREYLGSPIVGGIRKDGFFVFQEPSSHLNPLMTLGEQVGEGSFSGAAGVRGVLRTLWEGSPGEALDSILRVHPKPYRPSGGEKQRILLAMALQKIDMLPESSDALFIFDEPSGSLDNHYRDLFLSLLFERYRRKPFTVLLITHDYSMISAISASHGDLMEKLAFRELVRGEGGLEVRDFEPGAYTAWVEGLRESAGSRAGPRREEPLLIVQPHLEIFRRKLLITRDFSGKIPGQLVIRPGRMAYLKAPSGTGKTSLAKRIMGLVPAGAFEAALKGMSLNGDTPRRFWQERVWGKAMTMVFQHADEALNLRSTLRGTLRALPGGKALPERIVSELFEDSEAAGLRGKAIRAMSGGQKQRLNLLRGFALATDVTILDEPLNGLDFGSERKVVSILRRKMEEGKGLLVISHNEEIFDALAGPDTTYYLHAV